MTLAVPGATGFVALAQRAVIGTTDRTLGGRHPVVWPGSVYAWLCTSATLEGLAWQGLLGRRPDWGIGPPRSTGVRKGSALRIPRLGSDASGHRSLTGTDPRVIQYLPPRTLLAVVVIRSREGGHRSSGPQIACCAFGCGPTVDVI